MKKPSLFNVLTVLTLGACVLWVALVFSKSAWWIP